MKGTIIQMKLEQEPLNAHSSRVRKKKHFFEKHKLFLILFVLLVFACGVGFYHLLINGFPMKLSGSNELMPIKHDKTDPKLIKTTEKAPTLFNQTLQIVQAIENVFDVISENSATNKSDSKLSKSRKLRDSTNRKRCNDDAQGGPSIKRKSRFDMRQYLRDGVGLVYEDVPADSNPCVEETPHQTSPRPVVNLNDGDEIIETVDVINNQVNDVDSDDPIFNARYGIRTSVDDFVFDDLPQNIGLLDGVTQQQIQELCRNQLNELLEHHNGRLNYPEMAQKMKRITRKAVDQTWVKMHIVLNADLYNPTTSNRIVIHRCQPMNMFNPAQNRPSNHRNEALASEFNKIADLIKNEQFEIQDPKSESGENLIKLAPNSIITNDLLNMCKARLQLYERFYGPIDYQQMLNRLEEKVLEGQTLNPLSKEEIIHLAIYNRFEAPHGILVINCKPYTFKTRDSTRNNAYMFAPYLVKGRLIKMLETRVSTMNQQPVRTASLPRVTRTDQFFLRTEEFEQICINQRERHFGSNINYITLQRQLNEMNNTELQKHFVMQIEFIETPNARVNVHTCASRSILSRGSFILDNARRVLDVVFKTMTGTQSVNDEDRIECKDWVPSSTVVENCKNRRIAIGLQEEIRNINFQLLWEQFNLPDNKENSDWIKRFFLMDIVNPLNKYCRFNILNLKAYCIITQREGFDKGAAKRRLPTIIKEGIENSKWKTVQDAINSLGISPTISEKAEAQRRAIGLPQVPNYQEMIKTLDSMQANELRLHYFQNSMDEDDFPEYRTDIHCTESIAVFASATILEFRGKSARDHLRLCFKNIVSNGALMKYKIKQDELANQGKKATEICNGVLTQFLSDHNLDPIDPQTGFPNHRQLIDFLSNPENDIYVRSFYLADALESSNNKNNRLRIIDCKEVHAFSETNKEWPLFYTMRRLLFSRIKSDMKYLDRSKLLLSRIKTSDLQPYIIQNNERVFVDYSNAFNRGAVMNSRSTSLTKAISNNQWPNPNKFKVFFEACISSSNSATDSVMTYFLVDGRCWSPGQSFAILIQCIYYIGKGDLSRPRDHCREAYAPGQNDQTRTEKQQLVYEIVENGHKTYVLYSTMFKNHDCAFSAESAAIFSFGLKHLKNKVQGHLFWFELIAPDWKMDTIAEFGTHMFKRINHYMELTRQNNRCLLSNPKPIQIHVNQ